MNIIEIEKLVIINKISILKQLFKYLLKIYYNISSLDSLLDGWKLYYPPKFDILIENGSCDVLISFLCSIKQFINANFFFNGLV